jgi:tRNA modification GTPase
LPIKGAGSATIFALSTAGLPSAIAIVRMSGPATGPVLERLAGVRPPPRHAQLALLRDPVDSAPIDRGLALWFPGPASITGEDVAEFHVHGSRAVVSKLLDVLGNQPGCRAAEPGEFTRRAFANGQLDFSAAEGLADLLAAETEGQRRHALAMAEGGLSRAVARLRSALLDAEAKLEAVLNFSDEGDVDEGDEAAALATARDVHSEIERLLASPPAERLRDGIRVALGGPPNAGKSTLFNALISRDAAIVSETAGTTRDIIEAPVEIDGLAFVLSDTAGLRDSSDAIEDEGVRRAELAAKNADILLWLGDPDAAPDGRILIRIFARSDERASETLPKSADLAVSAVSGEGMTALRDRIVAAARTLLPGDDQLALNQRQRAALRDAGETLGAAAPGDWVVLAETLRLARGDLERLTGQGGVEDLLDAVFGQFCIGK